MEIKKDCFHKKRIKMIFQNLQLQLQGMGYTTYDLS